MLGSTVHEAFVGSGIIAAAMTLVMPSLANERFASREIACAANQRTLGVAMVSHANEDNGWYPAPVTQGWYKNKNLLSNENITWIHRLQTWGLLPVMAPDQIVLPDESLDDLLNPAHFRQALLPVQRCPEVLPYDGEGGQQVWSYNPSLRLLGLMPKVQPLDGEVRRKAGMLRESMVVTPAATVLLAETYRGMPTWYPFFDHLNGYGMKNSGAGWDIRHGNATFFQVIDGHVERLEFASLPEKAWPNMWFHKIPEGSRPDRLKELITNTNHRELRAINGARLVRAGRI